MPKAPTLTERQMKFAELLIFGNPKDGTPMSASEAAFKAGYRPRPNTPCLLYTSPSPRD